MILILILVLPSRFVAQTLPQNFSYSDETHILSTGGQVISDFYNEDSLASIYLAFSQSDYWQMMHDATANDTYVMGTLTYDDKVLDSIGVRFKGNTSYSKIKTEEKLSFGISLDNYIKGQDIEGYNTLNLNNAYQDYTMMREVFFLHQNRKNIPAAQGNFVKLYINNEFWGIYNNVQQLNTDFTREWFMTNNGSLWRADNDATGAGGGGTRPPGGGRPGGGGGAGSQWGDGTTALNYLGDDTTLYQTKYTLKSSDQDSPWNLLLKLTDVLNNTPQDLLLDSLNRYLDVDRTLWFLAHEIAFSDDDSYIYKGRQDYYLYYEPETGKCVPLEFDGNSVMNPKNNNWEVFMNADNVNYPLLNKLLAIPELRQRYLAHFRTIVDELFDEEQTGLILDEYYDLISEDLKLDTKKLFTNTQYEAAVLELKQYISDRRAFLLSNAELNVTSLNIESVSWEVDGVPFANPSADEKVSVTAKVSGNIGVGAVYLYYATGYVGSFTKVVMSDNGNGTYMSEIPNFNAGEYVRYYVEAIADNDALTASYSPVGAEHDVYLYRVNMAEEVLSDLVINEVMASNKSIVMDEYGDTEDWIEIFNTSNEAISLEGYYLTDNATELSKWAMPNVNVEANGFLTFWADNDDEEGPFHTNFKLSADGEELLLVTPDLKIADQVFFTNQYADISYARLPNGTGDFTLLAPTYDRSNDTYLSLDDTNPIDVMVYPNPVSDVLIIKSNEVIKGVELYSISGHRINTSIYTLNSIDMSQLSEGVYLLRIDLGSSIITKRVVKL